MASSMRIDILSLFGKFREVNDREFERVLYRTHTPHRAPLANHTTVFKPVSAELRERRVQAMQMPQSLRDFYGQCNPAAVLEALKQVTSRDGNGHVHVRVVDDDPHVADTLRQSLPESTFKIESAEDGVAGLQAIEAQRPDVVLLDIMMPRLDGFGVIERLRENPETQNLPVIVISAKELTDDEMKTLEERVNFVMKKQGFDGEKLNEEINRVLKK